MRKNDLIALLNTIEGNPEVMLWNGFVQDCTHISKELVPHDLVKMNKDYFLKTCEIEEQVNRKDWSYKLTDVELKDCLDSYKKHHDWGFNEFVDDEDIKQKRYNKKKIVLLQAKISGKTYHDRLGKMEY